MLHTASGIPRMPCQSVCHASTNGQQQCVAFTFYVAGAGQECLMVILTLFVGQHTDWHDLTTVHGLVKIWKLIDSWARRENFFLFFFYIYCSNIFQRSCVGALGVVLLCPTFKHLQKIFYNVAIIYLFGTNSLQHIFDILHMCVAILCKFFSLIRDIYFEG